MTMMKIMEGTERKFQLTYIIIPKFTQLSVMPQAIPKNVLAILEASPISLQALAAPAILHLRELLPALISEPHLQHILGDCGPLRQGFVEGPGSHEGPPELHAQLLGDVPEGFQLSHVFRHASQVLLVESILGVYHGEHLLVEEDEEVVHGLRELDAPFGVVQLELREEVGEDPRVLQVDDPVGLLEHLVELLLGLGHYVLEEVVEAFGARFQEGGHLRGGLPHELGELLPAGFYQVLL